MTTTALGSARLPIVIPVAVGAAWLLALGAQVTGNAEALHHDALIEGALPIWATLLLFLLAWQAMIAAMMVPSSLPLISRFAAAARRQPRPVATLAAFFAGYAVVWSCYGLVALLGDVGLHAIVDRTSWLAGHEHVIAGAALTVAGLFQFTPLKKRCLTQCRLPSSFLAAHYRRGVRGGFQLGWRHGVFCVGCCAALMLLMFAAGVANLLWMATLTALMVHEKTGRAGERAVPLVGAVLLAWAGVVVIQPAWLPPVLDGGL